MNGTPQAGGRVALPRGVILLWFGAEIDIPAGYVLCDGANGTPDMRDKFVVGAGGAYAPGATGGSTSHFHTLNPGYDIDETAGTVVAQTDAKNHLPPYYALCWIMKL